MGRKDGDTLCVLLCHSLPHSFVIHSLPENGAKLAACYSHTSPVSAPNIDITEVYGHV